MFIILITLIVLSNINTNTLSLEEANKIISNAKIIDICYPKQFYKDIKINNPNNINSICEDGSFITRIQNANDVSKYIKAFTSVEIYNGATTANFSGYDFYFLDEDYSVIAYISGWNHYSVSIDSKIIHLYSADMSILDEEAKIIAKTLKDNIIDS